MSGPKVVRIVTREELVTLCEGHLARVGAAVAEWVRVGRRNDCISEADVAQAEARLARLRILLTDDRFMDLQKQAPREIAFLHQDLQDRLTKVAEAAATARSVQRRQADAAGALLRALQRRGTDLPPDLEAALAKVAAGQADPDTMAKGFALLSADSSSDRQARHALAQSLKDGAALQTLAGWISEQPGASADPLYARLETRLAELALIAESKVIKTFEARLQAARSAEEESRRNLLLDSLELDLAAELVGARKDAAAREDFQMVLAELALADPVAHQDLTKRWEIRDGNVVDLVAEATRVLCLRRDAQAAAARRAAVLQGLAGLGYEVGADLATAWVEHGRVVLRKVAQPDYGVEVSGDPSVARMQMRVVAFGEAGAGPNLARDSDAETLWCGDVAVLQQGLAELGGGLVIERAQPVGATPLKRVALPATALSQDAREGPITQTRTVS
ncbi:hypothetical protein [Phenylobacterium aquaticum]|uniref:hypothetical protein n=1 Tax=Phenylobacterium aquaticum TaxID=1763816 RepID=UPI001F5D7791|nr:hypothetical protein [Phenylobacterium aquaticum]MCI3132060.1 hypothetical protein [Phenylobacterium aquaticum]